jgi:hypothetical protein
MKKEKRMNLKAEIKLPWMYPKWRHTSEFSQFRQSRQGLKCDSLLLRIRTKIKDNISIKSSPDRLFYWPKSEGPPLWSSGQSSWLQNGNVLCFLWGTNWIYICYVEKGRPPLWSRGQSSWLRNGDVLCFRWGTNWNYVCYVEKGNHGSVWVWNLISDIKGGTQTQGVWEQGAEEDIWTTEEWGDGRIEKTA